MDTIKTEGENMGDAIDDLLVRFHEGGPITQERITAIIAKRAKFAEGRCKSLRELLSLHERHLLGQLDAFLKDAFRDDPADNTLMDLLDNINAHVIKFAGKIKR